jgi:hypothetical protein
MKKTFTLVLLIASIFANAQLRVNFVKTLDICDSIYFFNLTNSKGSWTGSSAELSNAFISAIKNSRSCKMIDQKKIIRKGETYLEPRVDSAEVIVNNYRTRLLEIGAKSVMFGTSIEANGSVVLTVYLYEVMPWRRIGTYRHTFRGIGKLAKERDIVVKEMFTSLTAGIRISSVNGDNEIDIMHYIRTGPHGWQYEFVPGKSLSGKKALFSLMYITHEKRWKYGSDKELYDGSKLETVIHHDLPMFDLFAPSIGLVAVGVSSQEGSVKENEIRRAESRAGHVYYLLKTMGDVARGKEMYKLNLGQYSTDTFSVSADQTSYQRRVIVMGIMEKDPSMTKEELIESVKDALPYSIGVDFDVKKYSSFYFY